MVLVDSSVWVQHLRVANQALTALLQNYEVLTHEFIIGELACGNLRNRKEILSLFERFPKTPTVSFHELVYFLGRNALSGSGIGFVDAHLLASAQLSSTPIWTLDKALEASALKLGLRYQPLK